MSIISQALNNWLQRQNTSVMRQAMLMANTTEQERLELELAELKKLTRCKTLEKCPDPRWKIIRDETMEHKGDTFNRKLWVAVCGGSVEYTETLTPEGKRSYIVERFELKPESWAKEKIIAPPCSHIVSDTYDTPEEAIARVNFHKESIIPFWWKVKGASEKFMAHQEATVCEMFPPHTQESMVSISMDSAHKEREMGASVTHDYTLGKVITGTRDRVPIPRPEGSIGTYHTHPFGWAKPSTYDILDALSKEDKVMCIGATGKIGTKITCFTPEEPRWSELRDRLIILSDDIKAFNKKLTGKYGERGLKLRKLLRAIDPIGHQEGVILEHRRQELIDALDKQLLYIGYEKEWRPQKKVNGWEAEPIMLDSCRILWETIEEELPYEL